MARKTKCRSCLVFDDSPKVKHNELYYHEGDCLDKHLEHVKFLEKDQAEKDELFYMLVELHKLKKTTEIPPLFYQKIEDLRNDNWILGKFDRKYKNGVRYKGIHFTYDYCNKAIQTALNKMEDKPLLEKMSYCLGIVRNNVVDAFNHSKIAAKQKQNTVKLIENIEDMSEVRDKIKQVQTNLRQEEKSDQIDLASLFD